MSTVKTNNVQVGQSATATNNFTLYQPSTPDGTVRLGVGNTGATTADVASFTSAGLFRFNSGYGSATTAYGCRAWVNFDGQGTIAIRGSGNVSSITDNGVGDYTVNFTTALVDANYNVVGIGGKDASYRNMLFESNLTARSASLVRIESWATAGGVYDQPYNSISIFR